MRRCCTQTGSSVIGENETKRNEHNQSIIEHSLHGDVCICNSTFWSNSTIVAICTFSHIWPVAAIQSGKMSHPTRRFNLRTRKTLKNQLECCECKRNYFPLEPSEDDENTEHTEKVCCDCNEKRQTEPEPKRRAIAIKKEQIDPNFDDQCQSNGPTIYKTTHNLSPGNMVQIHSIELIKPLTVTPATGTKSKLCVPCTVY